MLKLFLSLRYLKKKKIVLLCVLAVALTVALLIVVDSLFSGLIFGINKSLREESGDMFLYSYDKTIPKYPDLIKKLDELKEVEGAAPYAVDGGLLWLEMGDVREAGIRGVDVQAGERFFDWKKTLLRQKDTSGPADFNVPGYPDSNGVWIGVNLIAEPNQKTEKYELEKIRSFIGKRVVLITKSADLKQRTISMRISDVVFSNTFFGDQMIYLPFQFLNRIQNETGQADAARIIGIKLSQHTTADKAGTAILSAWVKFAREKLGWSEADISRFNLTERTESQYLNELKKQLGILMLIFGVICSVAILLVFCIFYMIVETKLKDIAYNKKLRGRFSVGLYDFYCIWRCDRADRFCDWNYFRIYYNQEYKRYRRLDSRRLGNKAVAAKLLYPQFHPEYC